MKRTVGETVKLLREERRMSQEQLATQLGVSRSTIGMYESGKRKPNNETEDQICDFFNVDLNYLRGKTNMRNRTREGSYKETDDTNNVKPIPMSQTYSIPVYGSVPAGIPIEAIEDVVETIDIPIEWKQRGDYIGLKVIGSSMYPKYLEGDTIVIRLQEDCESRQDAVVYVNGFDATLKTVLKNEDGSITLKPINPEYQEHTYGKGYEEEPVKILGIVKELRRKI